MTSLRKLTDEVCSQEVALREGGGVSGRERQRRLGRLTVRERLDRLLDHDSPFLELGLWAAWQMYSEWGDVHAAGVVTGIGYVHQRPVLVIANDATVKAGSFFPQTVKKVLRAQTVALKFRLPLIYLVDSAGVFLPLQDEIFPDEDDFGRIFRNNAVISAEGIPQYAAVMGNCVAGGAYLPVLSDVLLMTEGSQLYLAGPALVKAAIGQTVDPEDLGGARMHAEISGTVDYHEVDDESCLRRLRSLIELLPPPAATEESELQPDRDIDDVYSIAPGSDRREYDMRDVLACVVDASSLQEYRPDFGRTLVTAHARIAGHPVGIVANQRARTKTATGELQIGGVLYVESAEKAARFVMDCNQQQIPLIFFQDVQGFMVGRDAEQSGIIRAGAKLVNAVSNSVVPKLTVIVGGSFGAGNYALCGKAYDPWLILAWPNARYAVMGADQAAETLVSLRVRDAERSGQPLSDEQQDELRTGIRQRYEQQTDIRYGAARGWVDAIIAPHETRNWLATALSLIPQKQPLRQFCTGVFQV
ncbi:acyl-CoA carboxylase subunit beta [bacterium]|nr:acyl-CoA carboxylase subunit beta [bacterium]